MNQHFTRSVLIVALLSIIWPSFTGGVSTAQAATAPAQLAAPGDLDPTFGGFGEDGIVIETALERALGMAVQPDGKTVVVGYAATQLQFEVFRYLPNGQPDPTFDEDGKVIFLNMFSAEDVAIQSDGKIIVVGRRVRDPWGGKDHLARLTPEGSLDKSFGGDGWVEHSDVSYGISAVLVQADGMIVTCGAAYGDTSGNNDFRVVRYAANGAPDTSFGGGSGSVTISFGADDVCEDVVQQSDGKLVVVGTRRPGGNTSSDRDFAVARLHPDGALDKGFDGDGKLTTDFGGTDNATAVALQPDGNIVVLGPNGISFSTLIARYLPTGKLDGTFGSGGKQVIPTDRLSELALQPDGKLVALGYHKSSAGDTQIALHRLHPNGTLDTTFGDNGNTRINIGGYDDGKALALMPDGRIVVAGTDGGTGVLVRLWPDGTTFDTGGRQAHSLVLQPPYQRGNRETVRAIAPLPGGAFLVAGQVFDSSSNSSDAFVARFTAAGHADPTFDAHRRGRIGSGRFSAATAIAVQPDGKIVMAGFSAYNAEQTQKNFLLARFLPDGAPDTTFGFEGSTLVNFGGGADTATALALAPDGKIVVAGNAWNGSRRIWGVARLTTRGQPDLTFDGDGKAYVNFEGSNAANAVVVQPDGKIIIGGTYDRNFFLQRLLVNGERDPAYGINGGGYNFTDLGGTDVLAALALAPNGFLYAAGYRLQQGNADMAVAQYTPDGHLATCAADAPCATWPSGTFFLDAGTADYAFGLDLRADHKLVLAGCSNGHVAAVQVLTDGAPSPLHFNTDFVGDDCAKAVHFSGPNSIVIAGDQDLNPFSNDTNIALARFHTTPEQPTPVTPPQNMLINPGFELDANNDGRPDGWTITPVTAPVTRDRGEHRDGLSSLRAGPSQLASYTVTQRVTGVIAGTTYIVGGYVGIGPTGDSFTFDLQVRWRSATNTIISSQRIKRFDRATTGFVPAEITLAAPAGATSAEVVMVATSLQTAVWVDDMRFALANQFLNGGFELDQNSDSRPDSWSINPNVTRDSGVRRSGQYAVRHAPTSNATYAVGQRLAGLREGAPYVVEGWVNIPRTNDPFRFELRVVWVNANNAIVGIHVVKAYTADTAGAWTHAAQVLTAPAGTTSAVVQMRAIDLDGVIYVDDLTFRP